MENSLNKFNNNYLIVDSLLGHTSQKLSALVSTTAEKFLLINKRISSCPDVRIQEALRGSVERSVNQYHITLIFVGFLFLQFAELWYLTV